MDTLADEIRQTEIDTQEYLLVLKRRWKIIAVTLLTFATLGFVVAKHQPITYEATGKLVFQMNKTSSVTGVGEKIGHLESIELNSLNTQILLVRSKPIIKEALDTLNLKDEKGQPLRPEDINLNAEVIIGTDALEVSYLSEDPNLAKLIVNQVMESYIINNILFNRTEANAAGNFIDKQLVSAKSDLDQAQKELFQFKRQNQVANLEEETIELVKNVLALDNEINNVSSQLSEASTREKQITNQIKMPISKALEISSLSQASGVQETVSELQKVQTQLKIQQTRYTDANPIVSNLKNQEVALQTLLQKRIREHLGYSVQIEPAKLQLGESKRDLPLELERFQSQRLSLSGKLQSLTNLRKAYNQRLLTIPLLEKTQAELDQKVVLSKKNYESLSLRSQDIKIVESQTVSNARILEYAQIRNNLAGLGKRNLISIVAVFGGLLIGVAVAFVVDIFDKRVKTVKEAEALFGYTLLGIIPNFSKRSNNIVQFKKSLVKGGLRQGILATDPRSIIHEAFEMLQVNLKYIGLDEKARTIAITSSSPEEGKSQVAANLAAIMAQTGLQVLLVDADLRCPSQHHLWNLSNFTGLSNVVLDEKQLQQSIQQVTLYLSVLTSGIIPPNPLAIIDSKAMRTLLAHVSKNYDYVVIDSPPLLGNTEGLVLSKIADGVLVVARIGAVDANSIKTAKNLLSRSEANVLGMVANAVDIQQEPNCFYYSQPIKKREEKVNSIFN